MDYMLQWAALTLITVLTLSHLGSAIQCSQCDTDTHGFDCIINPPAPKQCPDFDYCITVAQYSLSDKLESLTRTCSPIFLPDMCMPGREKSTGLPVNLCYTVCHRDGCNNGHSPQNMKELKYATRH